MTLCFHWRSFAKTMRPLEIARKFSTKERRLKFSKQHEIGRKEDATSSPKPFALKKTKIDPSRRISGPSNFRKILKPLGFTVVFSGCCYVGSCIWHYERNKTLSIYADRFWPNDFLHKQNKHLEIRNRLNELWTNLTNGQKAIFSIAIVNTLVFLLWRKFPTSPLLINHFLSGYHTKHVYSSMLLSAFSHYQLWHIVANMYVLTTFGSHSINTFLGIEQFTGFYLASAVVSNLSSLIYKTVISSATVSLGASGAILALLVYACMKMPDSRLSIIFLPFFTFPAEHAVIGIIAFETVGLFLPARFRLFDHAAHLGGALFGLWYAKFGEELLWKRWRFKVVKYWIDFRG